MYRTIKPVKAVRPAKRQRNFLRVLRSQRFMRALLITLGGFILMNLVVFLLFLHKTYPSTYAGSLKIGNLSSAGVSQKAAEVGLLPASITLEHDRQTTVMKPKDLGISVDSIKIGLESMKARSWLPIVNLMSRHTVPIATDINDKAYATATAELAKTYSKAETNAHIALKDGKFSIVPEASGYKLDSKQLQSRLASSLAVGSDKVSVPTTTIAPKTTGAALKKALATIQKQQQASISFTYEGTTTKLTSNDISELYEQSQTSYVLADGQIKAKVIAIGANFGISVENIDDAVAQTKLSLQNDKALNFTLIAAPKPKRSFTYCTNTRGVDASNIPTLETKLASVYPDNRGWSLGGQVSFTKVNSGCDFTVWLTAADQMASFGEICDADWSCMVGGNVVINYDRWTGASASWNAAGGSLEDYRVMVINHETGHWLGFYHKSCPGAGQPAPVMQQQSIDLAGCVFNPWPTSTEQSQLRINLGL